MRYLFDTNAVIYFLTGTWSYPAFASGDELLLSCISSIELLCGVRDGEEEKRIREFIGSVRVVNVEESIVELTARVRRETGLKLPDAIIAATAIHEQAAIFSADKELLRKCSEVKVIDPTTVTESIG